MQFSLVAVPDSPLSRVRGITKRFSRSWALSQSSEETTLGFFALRTLPSCLLFRSLLSSPSPTSFPFIPPPHQTHCRSPASVNFLPGGRNRSRGPCFEGAHKRGTTIKPSKIPLRQWSNYGSDPTFTPIAHLPNTAFSSVSARDPLIHPAV